MKVGVDGRPVMMYADERTGAIKVAACRSTDCGQGAPTISTIDHAGVGCYGEFPELDISRLTGFPILSYFNQTSTTSGGPSTPGASRQKMPGPQIPGSTS